MISTVDIGLKIATYCDVIDLCHLERVNMLWKYTVSLIWPTRLQDRSDISHLLTFRKRCDFPSLKSFHVSAWRSVTNREGVILLVGCCFISPRPSDGCLLFSRAENEQQIDWNLEGLDDGVTPQNFGASTMITASSGTRYLLGGWDDQMASSSNSIISMNPRNIMQGWSTVHPAKLPANLCFSAATTLRDGRVILTGGGDTPYRGAFVSSKCYLTDDIDDMNGQGLTWKSIPAFITPRCGHSIVTLFDDSLIALGGYSGETSYLSTVDRLDLNSGRWLPLPDMSEKRSGFGCALGYDGAIYVAGGSSDGTLGVSSFERYDARVGRWEGLPNMDFPRGYTSACFMNNNTFFISGGLHLNDIVNSFEYFDVRMSRWRNNENDLVLDDSHICRAGHQTTFIWEQ